jgi:excinuclease UvrABC nuclease subunit
MEVAGAIKFLEGKQDGLLARLDSEMARAAKALEFEQAAQGRDKLETLRWLTQRLQRLRDARAQQRFIYRVSGHLGDEHWHLILGGRVVATLSAPVTTRDRKRMRDEIESRLQDRCPADPGLDAVHLLACWFRKNPEESRRTLGLAEALRL